MATVQDPSELNPVIYHAQTELTVFFSRKIETLQIVTLWHRSGHWLKSFLALFDTGTHENFIAQSVVDELDFDIEQFPPRSLEGMEKRTYIVNKRVRPILQFEIGSVQHNEFGFWVTPNLPGDIRLVLGNIARKELGIELWAGGSLLIAHEAFEGLLISLPLPGLKQIIDANDWLDVSTLNQQQRKLERQAQDITLSQTKTRQELQARHSDLVRNIAAANATRNIQSEASTSRKNAAGSSNDRR